MQSPKVSPKSALFAQEQNISGGFKLIKDGCRGVNDTNNLLMANEDIMTELGLIKAFTGLNLEFK